MTIIAIDPGVSGAVAVLRHGRDPSVRDIPTIQQRVGKNNRTRISAPLLAEQMRLIDDSVEVTEVDPIVIIERLQAMPATRNQGRGIVAEFGKGYAFGLVEGVVAACKFSYELVMPAVWKRAMGLTGDKEQSRAMALRLFPTLAGELARKKDEGRAEALLIAEYWRRKGQP